MIALYVIVGLALLPQAAAVVLLLVAGLLGAIEKAIGAATARRRETRVREFLRKLEREARKSAGGRGDVTEPTSEDGGEKRGI